MRDLYWFAAGLLCSLFGCVTPQPAAAPPLRDREAAERWNSSGLTRIEQQKPEDAEADFRRAVAADPFCGVAHCNLGLSLIQQNKNPFEAAWCFRHAIQLMPKSVAPRMGLALIYEKAGQLEPAESALREALALDPDDIEIVGRLARVHVRQNKLTPETRTWLETVALNDADPAWRDWAARSLALTADNSTPDGGAP